MDNENYSDRKRPPKMSHPQQLPTGNVFVYNVENPNVRKGNSFSRLNTVDYF